MPEELALAAHLELGIAALADVQDFVDRRLLMAGRPDGLVLELSELRAKGPTDLVRLLEDLSPLSDETRAAWLAVAALRACGSGRVPIARAVAFLDRIADRLGEHSYAARGLDDMYALQSLDDLERAMRAYERELTEWLSTSLRLTSP